MQTGLRPREESSWDKRPAPFLVRKEGRKEAKTLRPKKIISKLNSVLEHLLCEAIAACS